MKNLNEVKVGMRVTNKNNGNSFLKITEITKFNIFIRPTNYPSSSFKVKISDFLENYEIVNN